MSRILYEVTNETRNKMVCRVVDMETAIMYYEDSIKKNANQVYGIYELHDGQRQKVEVK